MRQACRSADTLTVHRSQILLASARGKTVPSIAHHLSDNERTALHACSQQRIAALRQGSSHPRTLRAAFTPETVATRGKMALLRVPLVRRLGGARLDAGVQPSRQTDRRGGADRGQLAAAQEPLA